MTSPAAPPAPIRVVAAVIRRGADYLVCQRPAHKRHGGRWEFPGGKLHTGESLAAAARRELHEELGVRVVATGAVHLIAPDPGSPFVVEFLEVEIEGRPRPTEHDAIRWAPAAALAALPLCPSDRAFVTTLLAGDPPGGPGPAGP